VLTKRGEEWAGDGNLLYPSWVTEEERPFFPSSHQLKRKSWEVARDVGSAGEQRARSHPQRDTGWGAGKKKEGTGR